MAETDPLSLLRHYNVNKKDIIEERQQLIVFGNYSWPKKTKTNYQIFNSGKKGAPKEYYTLESLLYLLKYKHLSHPVYVQRATAENISAVRRPDRKAVLAYLNGEVRSSTAIDTSKSPELPIQLKRTAEDNLDNSSAKRPHLNNEELASRLDAPKASLTFENIKSLSDAMSDEKIAAIKAKRLAKKSSTEPFISNIPLPVSEQP